MYIAGDWKNGAIAVQKGSIFPGCFQKCVKCVFLEILFWYKLPLTALLWEEFPYSFHTLGQLHNLLPWKLNHSVLFQCLVRKHELSPREASCSSLSHSSSSPILPWSFLSLFLFHSSFVLPFLWLAVMLLRQQIVPSPSPCLGGLGVKHK